MLHRPAVTGKVAKVMLIALCVLLACSLFLFSILLIWSPGKPQPFLDASGKTIAGSISEKIYVDVNGVKQGMFIRGKNKNNPVVLFLHGGPGMPEYFLAEKYFSKFEENFTVCYWEQRGCGLSYQSDNASKSVTTEQLVSDTIAATNYLRKQFGQQKIYLMAHSWGTFPGIQAAAKSPELYYAYIGIGQISQQQESERLAYQYILAQYKASGNQSMIKKMGNYADYQSNPSLRDSTMHDLGVGTMHNMKSVFWGIFLPVMQCKAYTLTEKINLWHSKAVLVASTDLRQNMLNANMAVKVPKLDIPVYFFSGIYDYTVSYTLTESYFKKLQAPVKGFYLFQQSAHSPIFEEPEKTLRIMRRDVLTGNNSLADMK